MNRLLSLTFSAALALQAGCRPGNDHGRSAIHSNNQSSTAPQFSGPATVDACALALAAHGGESRTDKEIIRLQQAIPGARDAAAWLERLGWMFVAKGRESFDPGFYKLAEQCAACLEVKKPDAPEALLLRGHVLQNLHRFKDAEPLARKLAAERGLPFDFGLLGDVLVELGQIDGAVAAYQTMVDLKPDATAYSRIAYVRWLKGDLSGAREVMRLAAAATSAQAPESAAWIHTRLALYELQAGDRDEAIQACQAALEFQKDYPPAFLALGRIHLAAGQCAEVVEPLLRAARMNPVPEYQWTLIEALRCSGRIEDARDVEAQLNQTGAANDPRTFAIYLATRGEQPGAALDLAERELKERADVHTQDALAWALAANHRWDEARDHSQLALLHGTPDARIHLHAGVIAARLGAVNEAARHFEATDQIQQMLLPSEKARLKAERQRLASRQSSSIDSAGTALTANTARE